MEIKNITAASFEEDVIKSEIPVLVDFWAVWCGPCKMQGPVLEVLAKETDKIKIGKVNLDDEQALAVKYSISSIPTMMLFKDGKPVKTVVGYREKEELKKELGL